MGDRALVVFRSNCQYSPTIYLHWAGGSVSKYIEELEKLMCGREDLSYVAARFIGIAHSHDSSNGLSLGVDNCLESPIDFDSEKDRLTFWKKVSPGDNGVFIVDITKTPYSVENIV